jgi:hypothetical protein
MGALEKLRRRTTAAGRTWLSSAEEDLPGGEAEARLREILREDPNDIVAFSELAEIVRRQAARRQRSDQKDQESPQKARERAKTAADDAVWALAEELARSGRAWFPLIELARLSVHNDREASLRRLATAAERDPHGSALVKGLQMLRETGLPGDALNLGMGHWRPREHDPQAGKHLVQAAIEAGRAADARRHLDALSQHPDQGTVTALRVQLEQLLARAERHPHKAGQPVLDLRESRSCAAKLRGLLRR